MIKLYCGDCLKVLRRLPDCSVQCCVTSPPYWGLRDYGCAGQLGLEPTPEAYVARMVEVFREVRRVMRDDGTLWLNMGDSYNAYNGNAGPGSGFSKGAACDSERPHLETGHGLRTPGLKPKDLCGIPWRLAFALQADGWYLRSDIIWHKPNPMPESVRDRPTKAHEYVFLMSKSERYFWDQEAVKEEAEYGRRTWKDEHFKNGDIRIHHKGTTTGGDPSAGRNIRSVWTITPKPFRGAHFATFPSELVRRCVLAGTSERGCCPQCGKAWERVTTVTPEYQALLESNKMYGNHRHGSGYTDCLIDGSRGTARNKNGGIQKQTVDLGFRPACICPAADPVPCVVLDPFVGSGTTAAVCKQLGRSAIGIDLNPAYLKMARARIKAEQQKAAVCG